VGTDIQDIEKYLERLESYEEAHRKSSIGSRSTSISPPTRVLRAYSAISKNHVSMIEERIEDLNATLRELIFSRDVICAYNRRA